MVIEGVWKYDTVDFPSVRGQVQTLAVVSYGNLQLDDVVVVEVQYALFGYNICVRVESSSYPGKQACVQHCSLLNWILCWHHSQQVVDLVAAMQDITHVLTGCVVVIKTAVVHSEFSRLCKFVRDWETYKKTMSWLLTLLDLPSLFISMSNVPSNHCVCKTLCA